MVYYWFNHMISISSICFWGSLTHDPMEVASARFSVHNRSCQNQNHSKRTMIALSKQTQQWKVLSFWRFRKLTVKYLHNNKSCWGFFSQSPRLFLHMQLSNWCIIYIYIPYIYTLHTRSCYVVRSKYTFLSVNIIHVCTCILLVQPPGLPIRYTPSKCIAACSPLQNHGWCLNSLKIAIVLRISKFCPKFI